jgi:hypothetical protein
MGCYCIVEVEVRTASITISVHQLNVHFKQQKNFDDADDYCARNKMQLVAIETREEWDLLGGFLEDNLGNRGSKLLNRIPNNPDENDLICLEKYAAPFKTSGVDENSDGRWQWTSSKQPLLFRNWGSYRHNEERNRLLINQEKPFDWFNGRMKNEKGLNYVDYFICESSALQQQIDHVIAYVNAKVIQLNQFHSILKRTFVSL